MSKLILILFTALALQVSMVAANAPFHGERSLDCAPELQPSLRKILLLPEAQQLISEVQREGVLKIRISNNHGISRQFGAFWDVDHRTIFVNATRSEGEIIASIIFELHNARVNAQLNYFDSLASTGRISLGKYVESIEYLEYQNSKKAAAITTMGIQKGFFPPGAHLDTYRNFDEHFYYQKVGGHSAIIAQNYKILSRSRRG